MNWLKNMLRKESPTPTAPKAPVANAKPAAPPPPPPRTPSAGDPPEEWVAAIIESKDKPTAIHWIASVAGDNFLADIATRARYAEVRLAAASRIEDPATLRQVGEAVRQRDKNVYRLCQDRVRQRNTAEGTARRAVGLAEDLRRLLAEAPVSMTRLSALEDELLALPGAADDPTVAACRPLLAEAHARVHNESLLRRELVQAQAQADVLKAEVFGLEGAWPESAQVDAWRSRHAALSTACSAAPRWLADQPATHKLAESLAVLGAALTTLAEDHRRLAEGLAFVTSLPAVLPVAGAAPPPPAAASPVTPDSDAPADDTPPAEGAEAAAVAPPVATRPADVIRSEWAALPRPSNPHARQQFDTLWQDYLRRASPAAAPARAAEPKAPKPPAAPKAKVDLDAVGKHLDAFEQAIAEGHVGDADRADKAIGDTTLPAALEQRVQRARSQLAQLHGWARWGTDRAREQLIEAAEALQANPLPVDEVATQVPALRDEWKRLNAVGPARKGDWERFDAALTAAFAPVLELRAVEAERHAAIRTAKEALLAELEAFVAAPEWAALDHRKRDAWRQEAIVRWRDAGLAAFRDERALRKRFDALIAEVDRQADQARDAERQRRQEIVAAAEALVDATDLRTAIAEAKVLQQRWTPAETAPRLPRKDEQKLWNAFRAACDKVFSRRDEERAHVAAERQANAQAFKARLDAFAATLDALADQATHQHADPQAARQALQAFRNEGDTSDPRARGLEQRAIGLIEKLALDRHRGRYALMAKRSAIAEGLEQAAIASPTGRADEAAVAAARAAWAALAALPPKFEAPLAKRLEAAAAATADLIAAGREERASQLLDLEIALDLPSPAACADDRRKRQLARLQKSFGSASVVPRDADLSVAQWYATPAASEPALDKRIDAVVHLLVERAAHGDRPATPPPDARRSGPRPPREGRPGGREAPGMQRR